MAPQTRYTTLPQSSPILTPLDSHSLHTFDSLVAVPADSSYNYNSGIASSPPPSFRSRPSIDGEADFSTVQMTPGSSIRTLGGMGTSGSGVRRDGSEETIVGGRKGGESVDEDLVRALRERIEGLEETIGELLLFKDSKFQTSAPGGRCCVSFIESEDPNDAEMLIRNSRGDCCVSIRSRKSREHERSRIAFIIVAMFMVTTVLLAFVWKIS